MTTKYIRRKTVEECPHCGDEVKLKWLFEVQQCQSCQVPILPCSICEHGFIEDECETHMNCHTCPLDALLKEAWIDKVMSTVYSTDSDKSYYSNVHFLRTLPIEKMEGMYNDWNGCEALDEFDELDLLKFDED